MAKPDPAEAQRDRVRKELVALRRATAHLATARLLEAFDERGQVNWASLCQAMKYAGGFDALRAAQNINDGNDARYVDPRISE